VGPAADAHDPGIPVVPLDLGAPHVADAAVQLHGGAGYMRGTEVERHYRDARIMGIGGGTTEIMNELIASALGLTAGSSSGSAS